jgi:hypothetical protein
MTSEPDVLSDLPTRRLVELLALAVGPGEGRRASLPGAARWLGDLDSRLEDALSGPSPAGGWVGAVSDPAAPLAVLREVKYLAKHGFARASSAEDRKVSMILYHAAIAAAFAFHGVSLTSRPIAAAMELYEDLGLVLRAHRLGRPFLAAAARFGGSK